ncbi:MAG: hypothetical protein R3222_04195 [Balneolaceae bacterium]|nr:hypothetical protein [Balneolaceae bacterium]
MKRLLLLCLLTGMIGISTPFAQSQNQESENRTGEFSGVFFGDFYWFPSSHDATLEGNNGFWIRRIYFTYDKDINDSFSTRLRLEMNSEGDFITNSKLFPSVKDAYLRWRNGDHSVYAGIASTPTWALVEDVWGYRPVEKSPLDLHQFGSSRDLGIAVKGQVGTDNRIGYHFMFGNGNSNRTELNRQKKFMLSLSYRLTDRLVVQGYGDYNGLGNNRDIYTAQLFIGYESESITAGALYAYQFRNNTVQNGDLNLDLASLFLRAPISQNINGYLRADHMFDPNPSGPGIDYLPMDDRTSRTVLIGGLDVELGRDVHLMPNIETVVYGESSVGVRPDADVVPRLTLMYRY